MKIKKLLQAIMLPARWLSLLIGKLVYQGQHMTADWMRRQKIKDYTKRTRFY